MDPVKQLHDPRRIGFASDNHAGAHPEVLAALVAANDGHQPAYGQDRYTARLEQVIKERFGSAAEVYPVLNGTGANVVALQSMTTRWESVICSAESHVNTDEGSAPETTAGLKLLPIGPPRQDQHGRITPEEIERQVWRRGIEHHPQPAVVTVSQATELGTVYSLSQLTAIAEVCHRHDMALHMDGARLSNAAAALSVGLREITTDVGVDVLSLGGTKNGLLLGEAIVVLNPAAATGLRYLRKNSLQLASKMRFVSAQLVALFEGDLWRRNALHANAMAQRLAEGVANLPGVEVTHPREANAVFARVHPEAASRLKERFPFYVWDQRTGQVRWMCAFDTTEETVDEFIQAITEESTAVEGGHRG